MLVFGADLEKADKNLQRAEAEIATLQAKYIGSSKPPSPEEIQKRIRNGQTYFLLKDYVRSSILLFDIVEDPRNKTHPAYADAVYYLAESLYRNGNIRGARGLYQELALSENPYRPDALLRLLEAATNNQEDQRIDELLLDAKDLPQPSPALSHLTGKALFARKRYDEAFRAFAKVPASDELGLPALYYQGVTRLAQAKALLDAARTPESPMIVTEEANRFLEEATGIFQKALNATIRPEQTELLWLSHLALGRIYHELGKEDDAAKEYLSIPTSSESFPVSRYEVAWVFIAQNDLKRAYTNLESMRLFVKEGPIISEVLILEGSILSNLKRYPEALATYEDLRQTFSPIEVQINETLLRIPEENFKTKLEQEGIIDARDLLPPLARDWMEPSELVKRSLELQEDLRLVDANIKECDEIAALLESKLGGKSNIESFSILNEGRQKGLSLLDAVYAVRDEAVSSMAAELLPFASAEEKGKLNELGREQQRVEDLFKTIPKSRDDYKDREETISDRFSELLRRQHQMALKVDGLSARLVALKKYHNDTKATKGLTAAQDAEFNSKLERLSAINVTLNNDLDTLRAEIERERANVGTNDEAFEQEDDIRNYYAYILDQQVSLLNEIASRLAPNNSVKKAQGLLARISKDESDLDAFFAALNTALKLNVEQKLTEVQIEKRNLIKYREELSLLQVEGWSISGKVLYSNLLKAQQDFRDLVLRSNVGIIDVSWEMKEKAGQDFEVIKEKKQSDLDALQELFDEALKEQ